MSQPVPGDPKWDALCLALLALSRVLIDEDFGKNQSHPNLDAWVTEWTRGLDVAVRHRTIKAQQSATKRAAAEQNATNEAGDE